MYIKRFSSDLSDAKILRFFAQLKFNKRPYCIYCKSYQIYQTKGRYRYRCRKCWSRFSLTTSTQIGKLRIPLRLWYEVLNCFALGLSAHKAYKFLGLKHYERVFKAYRIIREKLVSDSMMRFEELQGIFEINESFYGGKFKNRRKSDRERLRRLKVVKRGRGAKYTQQPVFGIYKRNGEVFFMPVPDTKQKQLEKIIKERIPLRSKVYSDTWKSYVGLVGLGYVHSTIDHGKEEYVCGKIHINGMEGFWGLSKVNMHIYKGIKKRNWIYYLKEMEFRYNNRELGHDEFIKKLSQLLLTNEGIFSV